MPPNSPTILYSARLALRRPDSRDIAALFSIYGDPATNTFNPAGPYRSVAEAEITMERWLRQWEQYGFGQWALSLKEDPGQVIGFGGLTFARFGERDKVNLGYRFATSVWGQGLATELSAHALAFGFATLELEQIWALVRETHQASRRVLEKVGLVQVDKVAEPLGGAGSVIYALSRAAYQPA
ncbi:GNAT family N-acetyltransferase [Collimonas sp.]|jgi:ribosomal-protein-alanine N-acetyltransferase|uniref:GNAT family N-acetyltransferase n=1 Tax=Collimonas sp. TaxID=1963772 RepID=UPI002BBF0577|nr:GNAT family N-acetyltransferase [Collimonas sp.]HWX01502.1 GNAT family N-acetyltransferase [Collimonas sp.]